MSFEVLASTLQSNKEKLKPCEALEQDKNSLNSITETSEPNVTNTCRNQVQDSKKTCLYNEPKLSQEDEDKSGLRPSPESLKSAGVNATFLRTAAAAEFGLKANNEVKEVCLNQMKLVEKACRSDNSNLTQASDAQQNLSVKQEIVLQQTANSRIMHRAIQALKNRAECMRASAQIYKAAGDSAKEVRGVGANLDPSPNPVNAQTQAQDITTDNVITKSAEIATDQGSGYAERAIKDTEENVAVKDLTRGTGKVLSKGITPVAGVINGDSYDVVTGLATIGVGAVSGPVGEAADIGFQIIKPQPTSPCDQMYWPSPYIASSKGCTFFVPPMSPQAINAQPVNTTSGAIQNEQAIAIVSSGQVGK